ncbi:MAG: TRIC cation channel family protein [Lachnospiraceae bacterium]|nr:TRIC cation channel family protein [Lachnospiraceae bacterium]
MQIFLENTDTFIFIIELIGTIAFASSGTLTAFKQEMDIFGVNVLAIITAVGGGCIRDLIIGNTPPVMFREPVYALVAMITCNVLILLFYLNRRHLTGIFFQSYERLMLILDAIGLGIFTVTGVSTGMHTPYYDNLFLVVFLGVITGVGGGVLRDILAVQKPYILVKHVYACASLLGALCCALLWPFGSILAIWVGAAVVLVIRILAMTFRWNLPKVTEGHSA